MANKLSRTQKLFYKWKIAEMSLQADRLVSPTFSSGEGDEDVWCMELRLRGKCGQVDDQVGLYLTLVESVKNIRLNYCKFAILKAEVKINKRSFVCEYSEGDSRGFNSYTTRANLLNTRENGAVTILCELKVSWSDNLQWRDCHRDQLINDLRRSVEDPKFCDIVVIVGDKTFHAHRHILAARSRPLAAALQDKTGENSKFLEIRDLEPQAVEQTLRFMYTGEVCGPEAITSGVLAAAHRFGLDGLKAECEEVLPRNITVDDAVRMLLLGFVHDADRLATAAFEFIQLNLEAVRDTLDFRLLCDCVQRWEKTERYVT